MNTQYFHLSTTNFFTTIRLYNLNKHSSILTLNRAKVLYVYNLMMYALLKNNPRVIVELSKPFWTDEYIERKEMFPIVKIIKGRFFSKHFKKNCRSKDCSGMIDCEIEVDNMCCLYPFRCKKFDVKDFNFYYENHFKEESPHNDNFRNNYVHFISNTMFDLVQTTEIYNWGKLTVTSDINLNECVILYGIIIDYNQYLKLSKNDRLNSKLLTKMQRKLYNDYFPKINKNLEINLVKKIYGLYNENTSVSELIKTIYNAKLLCELNFNPYWKE